MKSLAQALVEAVAFLELSSDQVVDPDLAVQAMESISHSLQSASERERQAVLDYCHSQAEKLAATWDSADQKRRAFYQQFGEAMGLTRTSKSRTGSRQAALHVMNRPDYTRVETREDFLHRLRNSPPTETS